MTAPAPNRSSIAGRRLLSRHASPAGITAKVRPNLMAAFALAVALRMQAVITVACPAE